MQWLVTRSSGNESKRAGEKETARGGVGSAAKVQRQHPQSARQKDSGEDEEGEKGCRG